MTMDTPTDEVASRESDVKYINMEQGDAAPSNAPTSAAELDGTGAAQETPTNTFRYRKNLLFGIFVRAVPVIFLIWFFASNFEGNQEGRVSYIGYAALATYLSILEFGIIIAVYWHMVVNPVQESPSDNQDALISSQEPSTGSSPQVLYRLELSACRRFLGVTPVVMTVFRELIPMILSIVFRFIGHEYHERSGQEWTLYLNAAIMLLPVVANLIAQHYRPNPKSDASMRFLALILRDFYTSEFVTTVSEPVFSCDVVYELLFYGDFLRLCLLNCGCMHGIVE